MNKTGKIAILMAMAALLAFSSPCWGATAGRFASALKDKFCGGLQDAAWYGCYGYMHYRLDLAKDKNGARSICYKNGCGSKYGKTDPAQVPACYAGCDKAYEADMP